MAPATDPGQDPDAEATLDDPGAGHGRESVGRALGGSGQGTEPPGPKQPPDFAKPRVHDDARPNCNTTPPEQLLETIFNRIMAVSRVHDRIYSDGHEPGYIGTLEFIESICRDLATQFEASIETDVDHIMMSVDKSVPMVMIVNELVTNAVKYGRRGNERAKVKVSLKSQGEGRWMLSVADNGPGIDPKAQKSQLIGMRLIRSLATQLGGSVEVSSSPFRSRFSIGGVRIA